MKVSCHSLGLNFQDELNYLFQYSDYIHLSDNDGKSDQNMSLQRDSELFNILKGFDFSGKIVTLEVYDSVHSISYCYKLLLSELQL